MTQKLDNNSGVTKFDISDLIDLTTSELAKYYWRYPKIQSMYELDDIVQDIIMWYLQPMKNGEIRLEHYERLYDYKHLYNMIKASLRQTMKVYTRYNEYKYYPSSLNIEIGDGNNTEMLELIPDRINIEQEVVQEQEFTTLLNEIKETLHKNNYSKVYMTFKKETQGNYLSFLSNPLNLINIHVTTESQMKMLKMLNDGYKKREIIKEFPDYDTYLKDIQVATRQCINNLRLTKEL